MGTSEKYRPLSYEVTGNKKPVPERIPERGNILFFHISEISQERKLNPMEFN